MNCLVIGGTGYLGRLLVAELLKKEYSVAILHRRPKHDLGRRVTNIVADRNANAHAVKAALAGKNGSMWSSITPMIGIGAPPRATSNPHRARRGE